MKKLYLFRKKRLLLTPYCWCFTLAIICGLATLLPHNANAKNTALYDSPQQESTITGVVKDDTGAPLPGVNIIVKGTSKGTTTDLDGKFTLNVPDNNTVLLISSVGYVTEEIKVGNQSFLDVNLIPDLKALEEIVVTGYGTQEKKDITGAVTSLKSEDFNTGVINSPQQLLQGKVAGVRVVSSSGEPGATQSMTIRGPGGIRTGNSPLFVIDGLPLDNTSTEDTDPMSFINPADIESIDVLKDASATAIYGTRGANGVVMITTKKGSEGESKLRFSSDFSISNIANKIDVFSADEFRTQVTAIDGELVDQGASTDWQDEITRTAFTQNYNVGLSGGSKNLTYYASLGMQDQEGILKESDLKRYSGRINVTQKLLNDRVSVDVNLSASNIKSNRPPVGDMIGTALSINPTYAAYDENGDPAYYGDVSNPLITLDLYDDITTTTRIVGNLSPSVEIIKGLTYRFNLGIQHMNSTRDEQWLPSTTPQQDGRLNSTFRENKNLLLEHYLTYELKKGAHTANFLAGYSYQKYFNQYRWWSISDFPDNGVEPRYNAGQGQEINVNGDNYNESNWPDGEASENELQSFFARVNYAFQDKYLVTATVRVDGSSKFGDNNKYGTFPSFSLGWRISEEPFMQSSIFSDLKLRAGWGQTGNQEIPGKITQALSVVSTDASYPFSDDGDYPAGVYYERVDNPDLQWEVSTQTNIGLDFSLFDGALSGSVDYFNKVSDNILLPVQSFDPIQPVTEYWTNLEDLEITNNGVEVALAYQHRSANSIRYGFGANATFIDNNVEGSPYTVLTTGSASGSGLTSATINGYVNSQPIGTFFLYDFIGIDEDGMSVYRDVDDNGEINDKDRISAGSALPNTTYNFYGMVGYKGFDLTVNFNGVSGNKIYDNTANALFYKARLAKSLNTTSAAVEYPEESNENPASVSTRYLKDGAFLRLNNLTLGYTFNTEALGIGEWIDDLRISVTGQNLFVITDYDGYDPEVNTDKSTSYYSSYGIDYQSYPKARSIVFGLNVTF